MYLQKTSVVRLTYLLLINCFIQFSESQLRITGGSTDKAGRDYLVYFLQADESIRNYDAWVCGGAIVTKWYILTSAACVQDVQFMYVISGTNDYVTYRKLDGHECASYSKKKIVEFCVPKGYEFAFDKLDFWSNIDIALAKVESPFELDKKTHASCDHSPNLIRINFYEKWQKPSTDALIFGWGHARNVRRPADPKDYNQKRIKFATTQIIPKPGCKEDYKNSNITVDMDNIIEKYMICTNNSGKIGGDGKLINNTVTEFMEGCNQKDTNLRAKCIEDLKVTKQKEAAYIDYTRKFSTGGGICQNDHGGPLVTWIGSQEFVIGVASVFLIVGQDIKCAGPYLFTSTFCNSGFLRCVLKDEDWYNEFHKDGSASKPKQITTKPTTTTTEDTMSHENELPTDETHELLTPEPFEPTTHKPYYPTTREPDDLTTPEPDEPTTPEPDEPTTREPDDPTTPETDEPVTQESDEPTTYASFELPTDDDTMRDNKYRSIFHKKKNSYSSSTRSPKHTIKLSEDDNDILSYLNLLRRGPELDDYCNQSARKRGFEIINKKISWKDHPDGPADNEREEIFWKNLLERKEKVRNN